MTYDAGIGILCRQFLEQGEHRGLLGLSPGVIRMTFLIETALVADTEGTTVVVAGMSPTDILPMPVAIKLSTLKGLLQRVALQ